MSVGEGRPARSARKGLALRAVSPDTTRARVAPSDRVKPLMRGEIDLHHRTVLGSDIWNAKTGTTNLMQPDERAGQGIAI